MTLFAAMLAMLGLAASVEEVGVEVAATASFVVAYASMRILMTGLFLRVRRHVPASLRPFVVLYAAGNALGAAVWLSSLLVPQPGRYTVWAAGLFVELLGPILAVRTLSNPRVSFHPHHIPERYGLFTIIVLGESVLAVAVGTTDTNWEPSAVLTAAFGFVVAACVWWLYFDHVGSSGIGLGPRPAFYWGYGHFAVYAGIAAFGVGTQLAIEAAAAATAGGGYDLGARLVLAGDLALYLAGIAFVDRVNEGAVGDRAVLARLATAALLIILAILGAPLPPPAFVALVTLVLLALTVLESLYEDPASLGRR